MLQVEHNRRGSLLSDIRGNGFDVDVVGVPARRCDNLTRPRVRPVRIPLKAHAELVRNRRKNLLRTGTLRLSERDVRLSPGLRLSPHSHGSSRCDLRDVVLAANAAVSEVLHTRQVVAVSRDDLLYPRNHVWHESHGLALEAVNLALDRTNDRRRPVKSHEHTLLLASSVVTGLILDGADSAPGVIKRPHSRLVLASRVIQSLV